VKYFLCASVLEKYFLCASVLEKNFVRVLWWSTLCECSSEVLRASVLVKSGLENRDYGSRRSAALTMVVTGIMGSNSARGIEIFPRASVLSTAGTEYWRGMVVSPHFDYFPDFIRTADLKVLIPSGLPSELPDVPILPPRGHTKRILDPQLQLQPQKCQVSSISTSTETVITDRMSHLYVS
jgi:hypothetical protein